MYKIGSPQIAAIPLRDSSFLEVFTDLRKLGYFYGTEVDGKRNDFFPVLQRALLERITKPIEYWKSDLKSCFFKPYTDKKEAVNALALGVGLRILTVLAGLSIFLSGVSLFCLIVFFSLPAFVEFATGIVGLCQAGYHQIRALSNRDNKSQNFAAEELAKSYLLDAGIHFALVIPIAFVSFASMPFDLIRFVTRSVASLIDMFAQNPKLCSGEEELECDEFQEAMNADYYPEMSHPVIQ